MTGSFDNLSKFDDFPRKGDLDLPVADFCDAGLSFQSEKDKLEAFKMGAFYLMVPNGLNTSIGMQLASEFNKPKQHPNSGLSLRGFNLTEGLCFRRDAFSMEQLIISRSDRQKMFPGDLLKLVDALDLIASGVLRWTLIECGVPQRWWEKITQGGSNNRGTHWFVCNQYSMNRNGPTGCSAHADTGFVTVLYIDKDGLEGLVNGSWRRIRPKEQCFVVNFGLALSFLTKKTNRPVSALFHRVYLDPKTMPRTSRTSFAAFASAPSGGDYHEIDGNGELKRLFDVDGFLEKHDRATWGKDA